MEKTKNTHDEKSKNLSRNTRRHHRPRFNNSQEKTSTRNNTQNRDYKRGKKNRFNRLENADDIRNDICRIEKEIWLEISEIMQLKL